MTTGKRYYAVFMSNKTTAGSAATSGAVRTVKPGKALEQFDARRFAAEAGVIAGTARVADWPRAAESTLDPDAEVAFRVEGGADGRGLPRLAVGLTGNVILQCQRGLHPMDFPLAGNTTVLLAVNERELEAWDRDIEDVEVVLAKEPLDLNAVLEDELLLSLPFAPLCDNPDCIERAGKAAQDAKGAGGYGAAAPRTETNPFGALRGKLDAKQSN